MRTRLQRPSRSEAGHRVPWRSLAVASVVLITVLGLLDERPMATSDLSEAQVKRLVPDHLYGVDFIDDSTGFAVGYYGTLLKTVDGGRHWRRLATGSRELLRRVELVDASRIWVVGHRGSVLHSADGGESWARRHHIPGVYLRDVSFSGPDVGWVVGHDAQIVATRDGGRDWQPQHLSGYEGRDQPRLNAVLALDEQRAVLAGEFGVIAVTRDGGQEWSLLKTPSRATLTALSSHDGRVTAVGLDGVIWRFQIEDPNTLHVVASGTDEHLFDVEVDQQGVAAIVGRSVLLELRQDDMVRSLAADAAVELPYSWFHGIAQLPSGSLLAVGNRGGIIKSDPGNRRFTPLARLGDPTTVSAVNAKPARAG